MKILVAVPAWDGKIYADTVRSLLNEQVAAVSCGDEFQTVFLSGCGVINQVRNQLAADFLASDADRLVFVDADIAWNMGDLAKIAHHSAGVVGGAYRLKQDAEQYPVIWLDRPELWANEQGLLEVASLPAGFFAISRDAFMRFKEHFPDRAYMSDGREYFAYFHSPFRDNKMFSEDVNFCFEWREAGGKVWLDPELTLTHIEGGKRFTGCIGKWLKSRGETA